jgi:hypothetical protein
MIDLSDTGRSTTGTVSAPDLPDLSGLTLLVVDDYDDALGVPSALLRSCGVQVLPLNAAE